LSKAITISQRQVHVTIETLQLPYSRYQYPEHCWIPEPSRAVLGLRPDPKLRNEPTIRVTAGAQLTLANLSIHHNSAGSDIWNGNSAIHICSAARNAKPHVAKSVTLQRVEINSCSGRGIVVEANDVSLHITDSCIHSCAATGLFVAGDRTTVALASTDVVFNGRGNLTNGRIVPGHSGVYVETGEILVSNCNVSANIGCGITLMSPGVANLTMTDSDVLMNGSDALEMPFHGMNYRRMQQSNNKLEGRGSRSRSSVLKTTNEKSESARRVASMQMRL
jgi:Right handed beta helix region